MGGPKTQKKRKGKKRNAPSEKLGLGMPLKKKRLSTRPTVDTMEGSSGLPSRIVLARWTGTNCKQPLDSCSGQMNKTREAVLPTLLSVRSQTKKTHTNADPVMIAGCMCIKRRRYVPSLRAVACWHTAKCTYVTVNLSEDGTLFVPHELTFTSPGNGSHLIPVVLTQQVLAAYVVCGTGMWHWH